MGYRKTVDLGTVYMNPGQDASLDQPSPVKRLWAFTWTRRLTRLFQLPAFDWRMVDLGWLPDPGWQPTWVHVHGPLDDPKAKCCSSLLNELFEHQLKQKLILLVIHHEVAIAKV